MSTTDMLTGEPIYGACADCAVALANGIHAVGEDAAPGWEERFRREISILDGYFYVVLDGDPLGFSMDPCDICRSRSGGDRYRVLIQEPTEGEQHE